MMSFKEYRLLKESMGVHNLGLANPQSLGLVSNRDVTSEPVEEGFPFQKPLMGKKPPLLGNSEFDDENLEDDDEMGDDEELGDDEEMLGDEESELGDEEEDLGDEESELGDDELGDDEEMLGDEEEELGDEESELGDEEEEMGRPMGKKKPMGLPHDNGAFMKFSAFSKRMKECACEDEEGKPKSGSDGTDELIKPGKDKPKPGDEPVFMSKKSKKMKKKMKSGEDCKCKMQKKESYNDYDRPRDYLVDSDEEFAQSMKRMLGNVHEKFFDGVREDVLIAPENPKPGDPGWAPSTRLGDMPSGDTVGESVIDLNNRLNELEKLLSKKDK